MSKADEMFEQIKGNIKDIYFYRNYYTGELEAQIIFIDKSENIEKYIKENNIKEKDTSPCWE